MNNDFYYSQYSEVSEQAVLGFLLKNSSKFPEVYEIITSTDFFTEQHRNIFRAFEVLTDANIPLDVQTIAGKLDNQGLLEGVGGLSYLAELAQCSTGFNFLHYAKSVKDKSLERQCLKLSSDMADSVTAEEGTSEERINQAMSLATNFVVEDKKELNIKQVLKKVITDFEERLQSGQMTGTSTGFTSLDNILNGLNQPDLIVLAARPSMGKTSLAMNICEAVALNGKAGSVAVFSMEMSAEQLMKKSICSVGNISQNNFKTGKLTDGEWTALNKATMQLMNSSLVIDDRPALSIQQIRAKCLKIKRTEGLKLVMVDYLTLIKDKSARSRTEEVGAVSRALKAIAKECGVVVLALSQLNRNCEDRKNKRPIMSDIRDSGEVEQDADIIMFLYRDEVYDDNSPHKGIAEVIIAKNRNGECSTCYLSQRLSHSRFENLSAEVRIAEMKAENEGGYKSQIN